MPKSSLSQDFNNQLHISHSQIFQYSSCSLKYQFQYVEKRPPERISINLPFGSAIHKAIEMFYRSLKNRNKVEPLEAIADRFEAFLDLDLGNPEVPVIYKKDLPDLEGAVLMGKAMLKAFHETASQAIDEYEIVAVEIPLAATLYTDEGQPTDFKLVGILDLMLRDKSGEIIVVDNKTAAKPMAQKTADDDNQMTAYSYLLAANKWVFPTSPVKCRFQVLRKLKTPKIEYLDTVRTADHRKRFAKIANSVLAGIDAGIFMPQPSWMCGDCAYSEACKAW